MTTTSRHAGSVPELDAPPSAGSSMPPELACDMARAGELLDLGDRVGARRIVRRVLDRAAPELLGELADLATDLGLGEEDLGTAAVRRDDVRWVPPTRVRRRPAPAPGLAQLAGPRSTWPADTRSGRPAARRGRDGGGEVSSYLATRGGVDDAAEQGGAARRLPRRLRPRRLGAPAGGGVHGLPPGAHSGRRRPGRRGVRRLPRGLPRRRARPQPDRGPLRGDPGRGGAPRAVARRALRRLWDAADAAGRATIAAFVAANDARIPAAPRGR